jgi:5-methylcytosine-specific restriction endonuclease McrA
LAQENSSPASISRSRYIPAELKRNVWKRAQGQCEYCDPLNQRRCDGRSYLQVDHVEAFALGGKSEAANLRLLCAAHNRLAAVQVFGEAKMSKYLGKDAAH